jgi:hypothetical protein
VSLIKTYLPSTLVRVRLIIIKLCFEDSNISFVFLLE